MPGFKRKKKLDADFLKGLVVDALKKITDPEIPVNIYDLGLIYNIEISPEDEAHIQMTLTSPGCPVAQTFPGTIEQAVNQIPEISNCVVELVWEPPWDKSRMSEIARLELGMFY